MFYEGNMPLTFMCVHKWIKCIHSLVPARGPFSFTGFWPRSSGTVSMASSFPARNSMVLAMQRRRCVWRCYQNLQPFPTRTGWVEVETFECFVLFHGAATTSAAPLGSIAVSTQIALWAGYTMKTSTSSRIGLERHKLLTLGSHSYDAAMNGLRAESSSARKFKKSFSFMTGKLLVSQHCLKVCLSSFDGDISPKV